MTQYFNPMKTDKAYQMTRKDPYQAKALYEDYLLNYPKDYYAYILYARNLILLDDIFSAEKVLIYALDKYKHDETFLRENKRSKHFVKSFIITSLRLLSQKEDYEKMYKFYSKYSHLLDDEDLTGPLFYCKNQLGYINDDRENYSYLFRQIIKYDEKDFICHAKRHTSDYNKALEVPNSSIFNKSFPFDEALEEVKKHIPSDKKIRTGFFVNKYFFKYDRCGSNFNKANDFFEVTCFNNTDHFITMCPCPNLENMPHTDLNFLALKHDTSKVKIKSQIEKFNQRYRR